MVRRASRAGSRTNRYRLGYGRIGDNRLAWLRTAITDQIAVLGVPQGEKKEDVELEDEPGVSYLLVIPVPGRQRPLFWNLSGMTVEEFEATRQFFNHLFDLVDPVVRERDKVAADAFANGDDSYARIYRPTPQFVTRDRPVREHSEGVHDGLEDAPEGHGDGLDSAGGVRSGGSELADGEPEQGSVQDNGKTFDIS